jgi:hypothetical protein
LIFTLDRGDCYIQDVLQLRKLTFLSLYQAYFQVKAVNLTWTSINSSLVESLTVHQGPTLRLFRLIAGLRVPLIGPAGFYLKVIGVFKFAKRGGDNLLRF